MQRLMNNLQQRGMEEITFMIVNQNGRSSKYIKLLKKLVRFPVYQEPAHDDVWLKFGGYKDDMFVYDRCGRMTAYIPYPRSFLAYPFVQNALLKAYYSTIPCSEKSCVAMEPMTTAKVPMRTTNGVITEAAQEPTTVPLPFSSTSDTKAVKIDKSRKVEEPKTAIEGKDKKS